MGGSLFSVAAQKPAPKKSVDLDQLRSRFTAAGPTRLIVKDEQEAGQGGTASSFHEFGNGTRVRMIEINFARQ